MRTVQELHPEFGYFRPSQSIHRHARLGLIGAGIGAALAAVTLVALTAGPAKDVEISLVGSADAAVTKESNQPSSNQPLSISTSSISSSTGTSAVRTVKCEEQTWPYIESKCLSRPANQTVRLLPHDAPRQTELVATHGASAANAAKIKRGHPTVTSEKQQPQKNRARQRNRNVEDVPERAYATPYRGRRIQPQRREWQSSW